jgi:hypothetical protein
MPCLLESMGRKIILIAVNEFSMRSNLMFPIKFILPACLPILEKRNRNLFMGVCWEIRQRNLILIPNHV